MSIVLVYIHYHYMKVRIQSKKKKNCCFNKRSSPTPPATQQKLPSTK